MSKAPLRLPADLRKRLAGVTERTEMISHALIFQAISDRIEDDEAQNCFCKEADRRYAVIAETGWAVSWSEMRCHLERRLVKTSALLTDQVFPDEPPRQ